MVDSFLGGLSNQCGAEFLEGANVINTKEIKEDSSMNGVIQSERIKSEIKLINFLVTDYKGKNEMWGNFIYITVYETGEKCLEMIKDTKKK